jgi:putative DNA primase/helicase
MKLNQHDLEQQCLIEMTKNGIPFKGPLKCDSQLHRFSMDHKKTNLDEWYIAWVFLSRKGTPGLNCLYGSWAGGYQEFTFSSWKENNQIDEQERQEFHEAMRAKQEAVASEQEKDRLSRLQKAQAIWQQAQLEPTTDGHTAYLKRKKVKAYGVRYGKDPQDNDVLIVPLRDTGGEIQAIQCIKGDGEKRIHGLKKGNYHELGEIKDSSKIYVSEGYATAASIHEASGCPVVVAFDCNNFDPVVANLKIKFPSNEFVIAGDDDKETVKNPGRIKAEEVAKKYRCTTLFPAFTASFRLANNKCPTDFNDLHVFFGLEELKKQLSSPKTHLTVILIDDLLSLDIPPRRLILDPWLPEQGLAMIYARRGIGKTFVALTVAYAIACGGEVLKWKAPKPRKVLYLDGEMPAATMQERLALIAKSFPDKPPDPSYFRLITPDLQSKGIRDLSTVEGQADVNIHLKDVDVVILDNLSTLVRRGNENEAESWLPVQEWALSLRKEGKSVLFVHHAGKGGQQRGTSKREDVLDTVISLKQPKNYSPKEGSKFEIHFEKARGFDGDRAQPFEVSLVNHANGTLKWISREIEGRDLDEVVELYKDGMTNQRDLANEIGKSVGTVNKLIKRARAGGLI